MDNSTLFILQLAGWIIIGAGVALLVHKFHHRNNRRDQMHYGLQLVISVLAAFWAGLIFSQGIAPQIPVSSLVSLPVAAVVSLVMNIGVTLPRII